MRSLLRMLKHIMLAMIAIIATVCITEVGLRGHKLYQHCQGDGTCEFAARPCPIAFQQLPPLQQISRIDRETGTPVVIRTNHLGLRGPEVATPKADGVVRIVCLGDDATLAVNIAEEASFPALVQQQLSQQSGTTVEVINAGIPGYCPLLSLAWAQQQLASLQPDLVVLCCDRSDVIDDRHVRPLARYAANGALVGVSHPSAAIGSKNLAQAIEDEFHLAALVRQQFRAYIDGEASDSDSPDGWGAGSAGVNDSMQIRQTWRPIIEIRQLCDQLSADFVVAVVPSINLAASTGAETDNVVQLLGTAADEAGVPYLDVTADFTPQASPRLFRRTDGTLSADGHRLFAELLSWAILHRGGDGSPYESPAATITPAAATAGPNTISPNTANPSGVTPTSAPGVNRVLPPQTLPPSSPQTTPSPLPTPVRRPRSDDTSAWSQ